VGLAGCCWFMGWLVMRRVFRDSSIYVLFYHWLQENAMGIFRGAGRG
jgi:hypothetical protein